MITWHIYVYMFYYYIPSYLSMFNITYLQQPVVWRNVALLPPKSSLRPTLLPPTNPLCPAY